MLLPTEIEWLNDYHKHVYDTLSPFLNEQERQWLKQATSELYPPQIDREIFLSIEEHKTNLI